MTPVLPPLSLQVTVQAEAWRLRGSLQGPCRGSHAGSCPGSPTLAAHAQHSAPHARSPSIGLGARDFHAPRPPSSPSPSSPRPGMLQECQVRVRNRCSSSVGRTALTSVMRASKGPSGGAANNRRGGRRQTGSLSTPHRGHSLSLALSGNTWLNFKGEQNSVTFVWRGKKKMYVTTRRPKYLSTNHL